MEVSERAVDTAVFALQRALMFKVKEGKEEQFRSDVRFMLEQVAEAEREERSEDGDDGLGELLHVAWRKGTDSGYSGAIHALISEMRPDHWGQYVSYVRGNLKYAGYKKGQTS